MFKIKILKYSYITYIFEVKSFIKTFSILIKLFKYFLLDIKVGNLNYILMLFYILISLG
jgi:hypothetical protein